MERQANGHPRPYRYPNAAAGARQHQRHGAAQPDAGRLSAQAAAVLQAVRNLQAGGARNCSLREIQAALETAHGGARWECGTIAARVNALVAAGRLVRLPDSRKCSITGATVRPVVAVAEQRLLVA